MTHRTLTLIAATLPFFALACGGGSSEPVTTVKLTNDSTKLSYTADLHSLTPTEVTSGTPALKLDWTQMEMGKKNALGAEFKQGYVQRAVVGHYTETPAQLEGKFLDLDRIATAYYRAEITTGSELDFTMLRDDNDAAFPGIDGNGTWLVGLICGQCRNPAPWYMTVLKPCSGATCSANVMAAEANNYKFTSTITLPQVTAKAKTNLTFDWSAVTRDFLTHSLNPTTDINTVAVMLFQLPLADVQKKLNDDTLNQQDLLTSVPASWPPPGGSTGGATSAHLYDFQLNGTEVTKEMYDMYFDPVMFPASMYSYMVAVSTGTTVGQGFRMLQTFRLE
jgi:hypothetical protein